MSASVSEESVGITGFTSGSLPGFTGILKHRFRDFMVNEVDQHGAVVRLESLMPPPTLGPKVEVGEALTGTRLLERARALADSFLEVAGSRNAEVLHGLLLDISARSMETAGPVAVGSGGQGAEGGGAVVENAKSILSLDSACETGDPRAPSPSPAVSAIVDRAARETSVPLQDLPGGGVAALLEPMADKESRRAVHEFFKQHLPHLVTEAKKAVPGEMTGVRIQISWKPASKTQSKVGRGQKRPRDGERGWVGGRDNYTQFVLYKENMDTQMAMGLIANNLHVGQHIFGFSGTKDKRGVTSQRMTAYRVEPSRLAALNSKLRGIRLGNFSFSQKQLQLGMLTGNEFRLLIRAVEPARGAGEDKILEACQRVADVGFINYFGLQRFGAGGTPTHRVGAALLRGEFSAAIRMILGGKPGERQDIAAARSAFLNDGDAKAALKLMPRWATAERAILEVLAKKGPGAVGDALMAVPRTLRMMYLHAYQSYLWNLAASHRVDTFGADRVVEGDLVLLSDEEQQGEYLKGGDPPDQGADDLLVPTNGSALDPEAVEAGLQMAAEATTCGIEVSSAASTLTSRQRLGRVHVVTRAEAEAGRWDMRDVVLPVPGRSTRYPAHATRLVYAAAAATDAVALPGLEGIAAQMEGLPTPLPAGACSGGSSPGVVHDGGLSAGGVHDASVLSSEAAPPLPPVVTATVSHSGCTVAAVTSIDATGLSAQDALIDRAVQKAVAAEFGFSALSGDYRRVVLRPKGFEWGLMRYSDPNDDSLVQTDLENLEQILAGRTGLVGAGRRIGVSWGTKKIRTNECDASSKGSSSETAAGVQESEGHDGTRVDSEVAAEPSGHAPPGAETGPLLALRLKFQLPSSCYATMLIRELTKQPTTKDFQAALSADSAPR